MTIATPETITTEPGLFAADRSGFALDDYDYPLTDGLIARYPLPERDQSRMMVVNRQTGTIEHRQFRDLPEYFNPNDVLALNNTQVLPARFYGNRQGLTGRVEILMLNPTPEDALVWMALMKPARKLKPGTIVELSTESNPTQATMEVLHVGERGCCTVRIHPAEHGDMPTLMAKVGRMPIPPYFRRDAEPSDNERYQTVFAKIPGAQAAPTAGLHFTPDVLDQIHAKGTQKVEVTLNVSSGTFRTVETDDIRAHEMDPEFYTIEQNAVDTLTKCRKAGGKVVAIGTTVAKTLETSAHRHNGQIIAESAGSDLFIYPGFQFQAVDALLSNFHLPKSTLLMLISAFSSRELVAKAYREALNAEYRFFSYGDCMLIL